MCFSQHLSNSFNQKSFPRPVSFPMLATHILSLFLLNSMAKQKVMIRLSMNDQKARSKAMKIAVGVSGVDTAALKGEERDQIEVIGEGVDSIELTSLLRKRFAVADLLNVGPAEKKEEEAAIEPVAWSYVATVPHFPITEIWSPTQYQDSYCSIM